MGKRQDAKTPRRVKKRFTLRPGGFALMGKRQDEKTPRRVKKTV
jgi:hypothetical protein